MPRHLKDDAEITKGLTRIERRKPLKLNDLARQELSGFTFIRRKINPEAKKQIKIMINSINTRDDLGPDTAVKVIATLKRLYLIDVDIYEDDKGILRVKKWYEVEGER